VAILSDDRVELDLAMRREVAAELGIEQAARDLGRRSLEEPAPRVSKQ